MPGFLLHVGAEVLCAHGGQAEPIVPDARVAVSGMPITQQPFPWVIAGCAMPPPIAGNGPCVIAMWETAAVRVTSMGMPVLLFDSMATCLITGTPVEVVLTQMRVKGI
jgi:hypothetical protein